VFFFIVFAIDRSLMSIDIFNKIPIRWHWACVTFRLHIVHRRKTYFYSSTGFVGYVCPINYFWGVVALYAFRTLSFPSGISKVICFLATKIFMIHLLDSLVWIYGHPLANLVRPRERITPPWKGNLNAGLVTMQSMSYGTFAEIYRDRVFMRFVDVMRCLLSWVLGIFWPTFPVCSRKVTNG
jgi:hypothetical protein